MSGNGGTIRDVTVEENSLVSIGRDGLHIEVLNGGQVSGVGLSNSCFAGVRNRAVWDNRPRAMAMQTAPSAREVAVSSSCSDPRRPTPPQKKKK
jgi:hypothetical protein